MNQEISSTREQQKQSRKYVVILCIAGLLINYLLAHLATGLKLPLYLDNIGSALTAALGGYLPGIIVGFFTNLVNGIGDYTTAYYGCLTVLMSVIEFVSPGRCALNHSILSSSIDFSNAVRCSSVALLV